LLKPSRLGHQVNRLRRKSVSGFIGRMRGEMDGPIMRTRPIWTSPAQWPSGRLHSMRGVFERRCVRAKLTRDPDCEQQAPAVNNSQSVERGETGTARHRRLEQAEPYLNSAIPGARPSRPKRQRPRQATTERSLGGTGPHWQARQRTSDRRHRCLHESVTSGGGRGGPRGARANRKQHQDRTDSDRCLAQRARTAACHQASVTAPPPVTGLRAMTKAAIFRKCKGQDRQPPTEDESDLQRAQACSFNGGP